MLARTFEEGYAQSIMGATLKRRESVAGVAVIGGIVGSGLGGAGRWGSLSGLGWCGLGESWVVIRAA